MSGHNDDERFFERLDSHYTPKELTPQKRRVLLASIESRVVLNRRPWPSWALASAGALAAAAMAVALLGDRGGNLPPLVSPDGLRDELLLGNEVFDVRYTEPLPDEFDAVAAVFLEL